MSFSLKRRYIGQSFWAYLRMFSLQFFIYLFFFFTQLLFWKPTFAAGTAGHSLSQVDGQHPTLYLD